MLQYNRTSATPCGAGDTMLEVPDFHTPSAAWHVPDVILSDSLTPRQCTVSLGEHSAAGGPDSVYTERRNQWAWHTTPEIRQVGCARLHARTKADRKLSRAVCLCMSADGSTLAGAQHHGLRPRRLRQRLSAAHSHASPCMTAQPTDGGGRPRSSAP
jgi:hypothetical protein